MLFGNRNRIQTGIITRALRNSQGIKITGKSANFNNYRNFSLQNDRIACQCGCGQTRVDSIVFDALQSIRDITNRPLTINSCVRCRRHNANVTNDENSNSRHITDGDRISDAVDVSYRDIEQAYQYFYLMMLHGFKGMGINHKLSFIHGDFRDRFMIFPY